MKPGMMLKHIFIERDLSYGRSGNAIETFHRKVAESVDLVNFIENKNKKNVEKINARKNYVINIVTAAEVYFKDFIKTIPNSQILRQQSNGISKLLDDKISIWDAYQLLRTRRKRSPV